MPKHPVTQDSKFERKDAAYWRQVHETAAERLAELRAERDARDAELEQLNQEIMRFEQLLASVNPLTSDGIVMCGAGTVVEGIEELGLANACREILKANEQYRTARGIRDSLAVSGYNLEQHSNPLASIHGVLKRLAESGEVEQREAEGKTRYRWKTKTPTATGSVFSASTAVERQVAEIAKVMLREPTVVRKAIEEAAKRRV
jgi:hypothetical protein